MKNLKLCDVSVKDLGIKSEQKTCICYGYPENSSAGQVYVCTNDVLIVNNFNEFGDSMWHKDLSESASPDNAPVNITYLSYTNCVSVGLSNGELFSISDYGNTCDLAGISENGILAMEWSPDQDTLVLVTKDMKLILMSCTYDVLHEANLLDEEFGEKQFITVGWGKKETQFHGSEGKQAAKQKNEVDADAHSSASDSVIITWRGDVNLFAVGFLMNGIRRFKVFDREGLLQYTSEKVQGLEANLSWRPKGNLLAATQRLPEKYVVTFFEKNGLKHGEFTIPISSTSFVEHISWSSDSEILALQCKDSENNSQRILLFTFSNYHWYLKQSLVFNEQQKISKLLWDNSFDVSNTKKMHIILQDGQHYSYSWIWNIDHGYGKLSDDDAVIAVIDSNKILATAFRYSVVPPPMASSELEIADSFINSITFSPRTDVERGLDSNNFFATTERKILFFEQSQKHPLAYRMTKTLIMDHPEFPFQFYNWHWFEKDTLVCVMVEGRNCYNLVEFTVCDDKLTKKYVKSLPGAVTSICSNPRIPTAIFLLLFSGDILQYNLGGNIEPQKMTLPDSCRTFNALSLNDEIFYLGLTHKGVLYVNGSAIMTNISSYFIHTSFLLLTTYKHVLLCTELTKSGIQILANFEKNESVNICKRKIERGAELVIVVPNDTRTVFQMPRGNLETIQPRPLSLKIIGEYLNALKYHEAFDLMRKQRINLNLIYDHDPDLFVENIDVFLKVINNNSWLSLFLSDLENTDVTKTMYATSYGDKKDAQVNTCNSKVNYVCSIVRDHIMKLDDKDTKVLPLLTTFVKKNTIEDFEQALELIKQLKKQESEGKKLPVSSDESLKYLLYMVDVNRLFDVALGMYDFDLVLLVADKSQKDPKEYIPMLNELNEMDENYKTFTINKHLKRYDKAVKCLVACGPKSHNELRTFVKYHSLYREALALFSPADNIYNEISDDFGSYLKLKKHFVEAGIVYERSRSYRKAIDAYKEALEWEMAMKLGYQLPREEFRELCWSLIIGLKEEKRHKEALILLEQYYDDIDYTITYAIENGMYRTASRLCAKYNKIESNDNLLRTSLFQEYKYVMELIQTNWSDFIKHRNRLQVVKKNKKEAVDYDLSYANKDSDLYSDAGSTIASSTGSGRTYRSSKNRRKHERKLASLKEGSQYEDTALIMALHNIVTSTFELRPQVREINIALCSLNNHKEALNLQFSLQKLLSEMKDSLKAIWTNDLVIEATNAANIVENAPDGSNLLPQGLASLAEKRCKLSRHQMNGHLDTYTPADRACHIECKDLYLDIIPVLYDAGTVVTRVPTFIHNSYGWL